MDDGAVNVVKSFVGDPTGDYRYLGEIKRRKHVVSYMFTDDASTEDGMFLAVGTVQYYVVRGGKCRLAMNDGKPTGIESDEKFYELQKQAYGEILVDLD